MRVKATSFPQNKFLGKSVTFHGFKSTSEPMKQACGKHLSPAPIHLYCNSLDIIIIIIILFFFIIIILVATIVSIYNNVKPRKYN